MKPVNWVKVNYNWEHSKKIHFPKLAPGRRVDIFCGENHRELTYSLKEIVGELGQPPARLCPLGWTVVGQVQAGEQDSHHTAFHHTYYLKRYSEEDGEIESAINLNFLLKRFWDLERIIIIKKVSQIEEMTPEEKLAWDKVSQSIAFNGTHYEVAVLWRSSRPNLPRNYPIARQKLLSPERKLLRSPKFAEGYQGVINEYLKKYYIRKVSLNDEKPNCE